MVFQNKSKLNKVRALYPFHGNAVATNGRTICELSFEAGAVIILDDVDGNGNHNSMDTIIATANENGGWLTGYIEEGQEHNNPHPNRQRRGWFPMSYVISIQQPQIPENNYSDNNNRPHPHPPVVQVQAQAHAQAHAQGHAKAYAYAHAQGHVQGHVQGHAYAHAFAYAHTEGQGQGHPTVEQAHARTQAQILDPTSMSVKQLKAEIQKIGLEDQAKGFFEKSEFVQLVQNHYSQDRDTSGTQPPQQVANSAAPQQQQHPCPSAQTTYVNQDPVIPETTTGTGTTEQGRTAPAHVVVPPESMSVKQLKAEIRKAGLEKKAVGLIEKSEFVQLLLVHTTIGNQQQQELPPPPQRHSDSHSQPPPQAQTQALHPKLMSVKQLKAEIRKAGLEEKAVGLFEKSEFVQLLLVHQEQDPNYHHPQQYPSSAAPTTNNNVRTTPIQQHVIPETTTVPTTTGTTEQYVSPQQQQQQQQYSSSQQQTRYDVTRQQQVNPEQTTTVGTEHHPFSQPKEFEVAPSTCTEQENATHYYNNDDDDDDDDDNDFSGEAIMGGEWTSTNAMSTKYNTVPNPSCTFVNTCNDIDITTTSTSCDDHTPPSSATTATATTTTTTTASSSSRRRHDTGSTTTTDNHTTSKQTKKKKKREKKSHDDSKEKKEKKKKNETDETKKKKKEKKCQDDITEKKEKKKKTETDKKKKKKDTKKKLVAAGGASSSSENVATGIDDSHNVDNDISADWLEL